MNTGEGEELYRRSLVVQPYSATGAFSIEWPTEWKLISNSKRFEGKVSVSSRIEVCIDDRSKKSLEERLKKVSPSGMRSLARPGRSPEEAVKSLFYSVTARIYCFHMIKNKLKKTGFRQVI